MTKSEKKIVNTMLGTLIGGLGGSLFGIAKIPSDMFLAATAPISYPILGGVIGSQSDSFGNNKGANIAVGLAIGICMIPVAPFNMAVAPFSPIIWGTTGAVVGAIVGNVKSK